jgi:serine/threonine-protein kinase
LHRDIKPENVILAPTGSKIADFGIARVPDSTLTREGGLLGTPAYSAPEGIVSGTFSPLSDQFSMAATLYEALSGSRAFPGEDTVHVASRITNEAVTPIARACGLNPAVDEVFARAFHKTPAARYPSAREFGAALGQALEDRPRSQLPTLPDEFHREFSHKRARRSAVGFVALGALLGVGLSELTARLRAGEAADARPVAVSTPAPSAIQGWLAPPARPRPRPRPAASVKDRSEKAAAGGAKAGAPSDPPAPSASVAVEPALP